MFRGRAWLDTIFAGGVWDEPTDEQLRKIMGAHGYDCSDFIRIQEHGVCFAAVKG